MVIVDTQYQSSCTLSIDLNFLYSFLLNDAHDYIIKRLYYLINQSLQGKNYKLWRSKEEEEVELPLTQGRESKACLSFFALFSSSLEFMAEIFEPLPSMDAVFCSFRDWLERQQQKQPVQARRRTDSRDRAKKINDEPLYSSTYYHIRSQIYDNILQQNLLDY